MLKLNDSKKNITLKVILKNDIKNDLIGKENHAVTLISEEQTVYLTIENQENCKLELVNALKKALKTVSYDLTVDFASFASVVKPEKAESLFANIVEAIGYVLHTPYVLKKEVPTKKERTININAEQKYEAIFADSLIKVEHVNLVRDLQDTPPNIATSTYIADFLANQAKGLPNVKVTILNKKEIEAKKMGLLLAVNAASHIEPRVVVLEYTSDSTKPKTALVGKGITFDSGGYSLKPSNYMDGMKMDMSGAAIVSATVLALAKANAKANVASVAVLTDNRIGGHGTLVESVITSYNGKTVEINNTDAEGRLVLADGITYAVRDLKADRVIDAATLTGSIEISLGKWFTGAFTKNCDLYKELEVASKLSGERVWRMPLIKEHLTKMVEATKIADLGNAEKGREAGSSTAAAFLDVFAEDTPYLHLDIAATADVAGRGVGVMLRTLYEMLKK